ncbi:galactitol-1-phosphate 5-dehydrogenase [Verrucomicrobium sp. BvORR106]|uniref:zinc-dependent alcohol dehydrogenase n=1 Tax=Verrucomicrobium sp. BvORR106 TaxID=1403819 RepID=UPI00057184F1|nr:galactitol-1-phosphate 5-dehydrogenase [Verrucomicrobium sp. BvORR106]
MKALTLVAPSTFEFGDAPAPQPQQGEVLVDIKACGICGSDLHGMDGRSGRRIPPIIMGHEAAGEISAVGEGVTDWKVGDRVTFDSTEYCGNCPDCAAGNVNLCKNRKVLGVSCGDYRRHGCFADQVALPQHILYRLPDGLAYEKAAFAEPVSIALHAVNLAPKPNAHSPALTTRQEVAVVVGAGLIGLLVLQALKARGWNKVYAVDLDDSRLALAKQLGADDAFNAKEEGLAAKLRELGGGDGVDASFEVVGAAAPVDLAIRSVRKGGTVVLVGNLQPNVPFPLQEVVTRQITLRGSCACAGEYPEAIERIEDGTIQVLPLLSVVAPLSEGGDWFHKGVQPGNGLLKVVLTPEG